MKKIKIKISTHNEEQSLRYWSDHYYEKKEAFVGESERYSITLAIKYLSDILDKPVVGITTEECEQILDQMFLDGYSKRSIKLALTVGRAIFNLAQSKRAIVYNPMSNLRANPKAPTKKIEPITEEEERLLWGTQPPDLSNQLDQDRKDRFATIRLWALLQLSCGFRKEEMGALCWADTDLLGAQIHVCQAYNYKTNEIKEPKTESGNRYVGIPQRMLEELNEWRRKNPEAKYLFEYNGKPYTHSRFRRLWTVLMDGINGISISEKIKKGSKKEAVSYTHYFTSHQLRHTFATNALEAGVNLRDLQYLMGHETPEMTLKYTHVTRRSVAEATRKLQERSIA